MTSVQSASLIAAVAVVAVSTVGGLGEGFFASVAGESDASAPSTLGSRASAGLGQGARLDDKSGAVSPVPATLGTPAFSNEEYAGGPREAGGFGESGGFGGDDGEGGFPGVPESFASVFEFLVDKLSSAGGEAERDPVQSSGGITEGKPSTAASRLTAAALAAKKVAAEDEPTFATSLPLRESSQRRGELWLALTALWQERDRLRVDESLTEEQRTAALAQVQEEIERISAENAALTVAQRSNLDDRGRNTTLLEYVQATVFPSMIRRFVYKDLVRSFANLHQERVSDRQRLPELQARRADLVAQIEALKQTAADWNTLEAQTNSYRALKSELEALDAELRELVNRDAERFETQLQRGAMLVLPKLELEGELTGVGPSVDNDAAVSEYLRAPVQRIEGSQLAFPVEASVFRYTSDYGERSCKGCTSWHNGLDIAPQKSGTRGIPTLAAHDGVVVKVQGHEVAIRRADGLTTEYRHHDQVFVTVGEPVIAGQSIGIMGNQGRSTGVHLHFMVTDSRGTQLNPASFLGLPEVATGLSRVCSVGDACR